MIGKSYFKYRVYRGGYSRHKKAAKSPKFAAFYVFTKQNPPLPNFSRHSIKLKIQLHYLHW
jgi:hypothetical protein